MRDLLVQVQEMAKEKVDEGQEPPWSWYQYMKLIETTEAILASMESVKTESSLPEDEPRGARLRLVDSTYQQDDALHCPADFSVRMPM